MQCCRQGIGPCFAKWVPGSFLFLCNKSWLSFQCQRPICRIYRCMACTPPAAQLSVISCNVPFPRSFNAMNSGMSSSSRDQSSARGDWRLAISLKHICPSSASSPLVQLTCSNASTHNYILAAPAKKLAQGIPCLRDFSVAPLSPSNKLITRRAHVLRSAVGESGQTVEVYMSNLVQTHSACLDERMQIFCSFEELAAASMGHAWKIFGVRHRLVSSKIFWQTCCTQKVFSVSESTWIFCVKDFWTTEEQHLCEWIFVIKDSAKVHGTGYRNIIFESSSKYASTGFWPVIDYFVLDWIFRSSLKNIQNYCSQFKIVIIKYEVIAIDWNVVIWSIVSRFLTCETECDEVIWSVCVLCESWILDLWYRMCRRNLICVEACSLSARCPICVTKRKEAIWSVLMFCLWAPDFRIVWRGDI